MINAKEELLGEVFTDQILAARITHEAIGCMPGKEQVIELPVGYSEHQLKKFLKALDFEYNNGYGTQYLEGVVWLKDGTWLDRHEYDGSEWWVHRACPEIPDHLKGVV